MTTNRLHSDDPRLTAYALGELNLAERAMIERELSLRPELRAEVEQIQRTAGRLSRALEAQPVADLARRDASVPKNPRRVLRKWVVAVCVTAAAVAAIPFVLSPAFKAMPPERTVSYLTDNSQSMAPQTMPAEAEPVAEFGESRARAFVSLQRSAEVHNKSLAPRSSLSPVRGNQGQAQQSTQYSSSPSSAAPNYPAGSTAMMGDGAAKFRGDPGSSSPLGWAVRDVGGLAGPKDIADPSATQTFGRVVDAEAIARSNRRLFGIGAGYFERGADRALNDSVSQEGKQFDAEKQIAGGFAVPSNEAYNTIVENPFIAPEGEQALSTFSIDVDTASYSNVRRFLKHGQLPPRDAVRIEELVNYFDYNYPQPPDGVPFSVATEVGPCPWQPEHRLVRIGLKGREIEREQRPVSNLVFLLDVSGSMQPANKLPLVKAGMELLVEQLNENDRISIVTYAGNAGLVLEPTSGDDKETILSAIRSLQAGGSTNGEAGIKLAYTQAIRNFTEHGSNRVILCTDGDFNVGVSGDDELVAMIQEKARQSRVYLSIFGFGMGNLKDAKLEQLANKGNGHYGYIDDLREARKVFSEELMGTLYTIAKDVKIQVEFNPQRVGAYRLIGYENRALANRDFTDDTKDAGEIGAGHTVTALYEVAPVGKVPAAEAVGLKYQKPEGRGQESGGKGRESGGRGQGPEEFRNELLTVKLRYKLPDADSSVPLEFPLVDDPGRSLQASRDFDWAAAVAAFGMVLRDSRYKGQANLDLVRELAQGALGAEPSENRREFLDLIDAARSLMKPGEQEGTSR